MENSLDKNWKDLVVKLSHRFGEGLDLQAILFLIGFLPLNMVFIGMPLPIFSSIQCRPTGVLNESIKFPKPNLDVETE